MNNQKIQHIVKLFKIFMIELLTARAGLYVKQQKDHRG